ncbi:MAG: LPS export ABC transporter periplasmic protein LptC [Candidatus Eutrophobiaceae bacterium]
MNRNAMLAAALIAAFSIWWLFNLNEEVAQHSTDRVYEPDQYMRNFTVTVMDEEGWPEHRLGAEYMEYYERDDTAELTQPRLEFYSKSEERPLLMRANTGWVTLDNNLVVLSGDVRAYREDTEGHRKMELITAELQILIHEGYVRNDIEARVLARGYVIDAVGIRAFLDRGRIVFDRHVQTTIKVRKEREAT